MPVTPSVIHKVVEGRLAELDLGKRTCVLTRLTGKRLHCAFPRRLGSLLRQHLGSDFQFTVVVKPGQTHQAYLKAAVLTQSTRLIPARNAPASMAEIVERLSAEGIIGMWADRQDIVDSSAFARQFREPRRCQQRVPTAVASN